MRESKERCNILEANKKRHECNQRFGKAEILQIKKKEKKTNKKPQNLTITLYIPNNFFYQEGIIKHFKVNYSTINMSIQQVQLNQRY